MAAASLEYIHRSVRNRTSHCPRRYNSVKLRINAASEEQQKLQAALEAQKLECAELEDAIQDGDHADYIAKVARESLGYVYPGELVFVDISSK